jgi:hypothetical protein
MRSNARMLMATSAVGALLALPAAGVAHPGKGQGQGPDKAQSPATSHSGKGHSKRCAKTQKVGYSVRGTLVSVTADNPVTPANEATVTLTVTGANSHARNSGEIADQNATLPGVQVAGATYTVPATDAFVLKLRGYEAPDTPSVGDVVHVSGKIARSKQKCVPAGTSTADRYATPDVRRVTITDSDPDA